MARSEERHFSAAPPSVASIRVFVWAPEERIRAARTTDGIRSASALKSTACLAQMYWVSLPRFATPAEPRPLPRTWPPPAERSQREA